MMREEAPTIYLQLTSLVILVISLFLFALFPSNGIVQSVTSIIAFLIVLPLAYIILVLHKTIDVRQFHLPEMNRSLALSFGVATLAGIGILFILSFTPYDAAYLQAVSAIFVSFQGFAIYELLFLLPLLLLMSFFCCALLPLFPFPRYGILALQIVMMGLLLMFAFSGSVFMLALTAVIFFVYTHLKQTHFLPVAISFFLAFLVLDTLIAKSLQ